MNKNTIEESVRRNKEFLKFLQDGGRLDPQEAMVEFGFGNIQQVYDTVYNHRRRGGTIYTVPHPSKDPNRGLYKNGRVSKEVAGRGYRRRHYWESNPYLTYREVA